MSDRAMYWPSGSGGRYKSMRAGVATSPHFPEVDHHTLQHGAFSPGGSGSGRGLATSFGSLSGFPPKPCGPGRSPAGAHQSDLRWVPFRGSFARRLRSRRTSLESGSGIGFHLCLTLLPSIALPVAYRRSFSRMSAAFAVAVASSFRPFPARRSLATKVKAAPAFGVAPSGICL